MNVLKYICIILLIVVTGDVISTKGVRGSIRSTRISSSRNNIRISETRVKVRYGSRYRPWNYGYNNWWSYGSHGHIYGFVWYTRTRYYRDHPHKEPTICRNEFDNVMDNGSHYEWFICPSERHTSDYHYCCGEEDKQHCCRFWDDGWRTFGVAMSFLFFIIFASALCYCCCCRRKTQTETTYFQRIMSQKISSRAEADVPLRPVPNIPSQPPPMPQQPHADSMDSFPPQPIPQLGGFMPMPQPQPGYTFPGAPPLPIPDVQPAAPRMGPPMSGVPPYPIEGGVLLPPSYTPYQPQPSAPPYPTDPNLPYPSSNAPASSFPLAPYPISPGYPNSPPPPYGQVVKENNP